MILNFEYLGENEIKFENILTHWSVAQAGSNDGKNQGSKISLVCPFNLGMDKYRYFQVFLTLQPNSTVSFNAGTNLFK